jgi:hypothetical protein
VDWWRRQAPPCPAPRSEPDGGHPEIGVGLSQALPHSVYDQPDAEAVHAQFDRILDALTDKLPQVAAHLEAARADILAFTAFPKRHGGKSGPTILKSG